MSKACEKSLFSHARDEKIFSGNFCILFLPTNDLNEVRVRVRVRIEFKLVAGFELKV